MKTHVSISYLFSAIFFYIYKECPDVLSCHRPGHSLGEKNKVIRNEKGKNYVGFHILKVYDIFEVFRWKVSSSITLILLESSIFKTQVHMTLKNKFFFLEHNQSSKTKKN